MRVVQLVWLSSLAFVIHSASVQAQNRPLAGPQQAPPQQRPQVRVATQPGPIMGPQPPAAAPTQPVAPQAPFVLTPAQEAALDKILNIWEQRSDKIHKFKCQFTRWDYDLTFGAQRANFLKSEGHGEVKFKAPDHGVYRVAEMKEYDPKDQKFAEKKDALDHWVCDGAAIFEFSHGTRQLIERRLPPELRGKAITDGPLPFIFGAKAETLKRRYFLREITPGDVAEKQIWLEAFPRHRSDAANFQRVEFILTRNDFLPFAMQIYLPMGKNRTVYQFQDVRINTIDLFDQDFAAPHTPFGWKRIVQDPGKPQPAFQPIGEGNQAVRPTTGSERK